MSRPSDHIDSPVESDDARGTRTRTRTRDRPSGPGGPGGPGAPDTSVTQPKLGLVGWLRWFWRQLTSMRTALFLLLLLAIAAVPGSLVPQRSSDPNGVTQYFRDNPDLAPLLDKFQAFDVYTSVWFSAIYLLLFASLIGCVIPRTKHHLQALRQKPPKTPARLQRLTGFTVRTVPGQNVTSVVESARSLLKKSGYRAVIFGQPPHATGPSAETMSVSAERGYLRETGNLVFHIALLGVLITVGFGGGFGFTGQRVLVEGQTFVNSLGSYDSFNPGRFFNDATLDPFAITVDKFSVKYQDDPGKGAYGQPLDFTTDVTTKPRGGTPSKSTIKVNEPLNIGGANVYLLGNGYAPTISVRNPAGDVVFTDSTAFLPQDANLTSLGVVKVADGLKEQLGFIGFFYPTQETMKSGAFTSVYPDLVYPVLTLNVYAGDLGLDAGQPKSVYSLDTDTLTQLTGGTTGTKAIELKPGESAQLPNGLGSVSFDNVKRFASLDVHRDPTQGWVLLFAVLAVGGLLAGLMIPRRRVWVKVIPTDEGTLRLEYAGLARGDDPGLDAAVMDVAERHSAAAASAVAGSASDSTSDFTPDSTDVNSKP